LNRKTFCLEQRLDEQFRFAQKIERFMVGAELRIQPD